MTVQAHLPDLHTPYQDVLPPLSTEEDQALSISIKAEGVRHPCLATEDGRLLDGHHRRKHNPDAPVNIVPGSASWSDAECRAFIYRTNQERRNLSPAQKREVRAKMRKTARELRKKDPKHFTEKVLARMFGVAQQTVSDWLSGSNTGLGNTSGSAPDARVKVPAEHYSTIYTNGVKRRASREGRLRRTTGLPIASCEPSFPRPGSRMKRRPMWTRRSKGSMLPRSGSSRETSARQAPAWPITVSS